MEGILYYKDGLGHKIPIDFISSEYMQNVLNKEQRNRQWVHFDRNEHGIFNTTSGKLLGHYKKETLYLLVQGTEFIISND